jgi:hypothetical protein
MDVRVDRAAIPGYAQNVTPFNFFFGPNAGAAITSGTENLGIGLNALAALTTGTGNLAIGHGALPSLVDGINNTAIGWDSQLFNVSGTNNTSLGEDALKNVLGDNNTGLGYTAGYSITTGDLNLAAGPTALYNVTTGNYNIGLGYGAGQKLGTSSAYNTIVGVGSFQGGSIAAYSQNTIVGAWAGYSATGSRNVFLGFCAGLYNTASDIFCVGNRDLGSEANDIAKSLLYGVMASTVAGQSLRINASVTTPLYTKCEGKAVSALTAASTAGAGARDFVTDASTTLTLGIGTTVTGGGSNKVPVYSDGTNWLYG